MDKYLNLVGREVFREMTAEIEADFFRYFKAHPEVNSTVESDNIVAKKYWRVVEIENILIGEEMPEKVLINTKNELQEIMNFVRSLS